MRRTHPLFILACTTAAASCVDTGNSAGSRNNPSGDTVVVTSKGDGIWGPVHEVVEVLRVPTNTKETTFGRIQGLIAAPDGGVFVFDAKGPDGAIIRRFDANGKFIRNIGRDGHGPGEYSGEVVRLDESNGVIAVRDMNTISRFTADGRFINGFSVGHSAGIIDIVQGADGSIYTTAPRISTIPKVGQRQPAGPQPVFHYDSAGRLLDSIGGVWLVARPSAANVMMAVRPTYETRFALNDGRVIVGRSDKLGFLVISPDGKGRPLMAEYETPPVPYLDDERKQLQEGQRHPVNVDGQRTSNPDPNADVTPFKPPLMSIRPDRDGRIWIMTPGPSTKLTEPHCNMYSDDRCIGKTWYTQTNRILGFRADGTFLGEIRFPKRSGQPAYFGDYVWSVAVDDDDVQFLVKYRLHG